MSGPSLLERVHSEMRLKTSLFLCPCARLLSLIRCVSPGHRTARTEANITVRECGRLLKYGSA
eukprot:1781764-Rhodomonas_salina.1